MSTETVDKVEDKDAKRTCPQCDGCGEEDLGKPIICRKCKGAGTVAPISRFAAIMCAGELEKVAQEDMGDEDGEEPKDEDGEFSGSGVDDLVLIPKNRSDGEIKAGISSLLNSMSPAQLMQAFEKACDVLALGDAEKKTVMIGSGNQPNEDKATEFLYSSIDRMNSQQLRAMFCELRGL
jgi:hypothetical protein